MPPSRFTPLRGLSIAFSIGWSDFVIKYRGSVLGYFWSLLGPLMKFLVILTVLGPYVQQGVAHYPLYLFLGIIVWEHFATTTVACMTTLRAKEPIIRHLAFPHLILMVAAGWTTLVTFATHLAVFGLVAWWSGLPVSPAILYALLLALQMSLLALGVGMMLAAYCLRYRDIEHLWGIALQMLFWLTPIAYPYHSGPVLVSIVTKLRALQWTGIGHSLIDLFIGSQPLFMVINDWRRILLYPVAAGVPSPVHAVGVTLVTFAFFLAGAWTFRRRSPYFIQEY